MQYSDSLDLNLIDVLCHSFLQFELYIPKIPEVLELLVVQYTMLVVTYISLFLLSVLCTIVYLKLRISPKDPARNPTFTLFQTKYIIIYLVIVLADWIQGPYLYRLYHYYGFVETQIAIIYVCGIVSSTVFSPFKDIIADRLGRKKTAAFFCVLYAVSCLATPFRKFIILIIGRCIAGLSNSLLFSTVETWYLHEHTETYDFPKEWIAVTFSHIAFGSSIVAVVAGVLADVVVRWLAPWITFWPSNAFITAVPIFLVALTSILCMWQENFGPKQSISIKSIRKSCIEGLKAIIQNVDVFLLGTVQSLFESVLFIFAFIWTPALDVYHDIPLGIAFASFMVCFMLGGIICDYLMAKVGYSMTRLLVVVSSCASVVFLFAAYFARSKEATLYRVKMLICLQLFELLCGFYFPIMRTLRERVLPDEHQLSIANWFRVPLTIISSLALLFFHDVDVAGGIPEIFIVCSIMMGLAFLSSLRFARATRDSDDVTTSETM